MQAYLAQPLVALAMLALVISAAIHMRIGLKEIIEDYVHGGAKVVAILLATFFAVGVGLACVARHPQDQSRILVAMPQDATPHDDPAPQRGPDQRPRLSDHRPRL